MYRFEIRDAIDESYLIVGFKGVLFHNRRENERYKVKIRFANEKRKRI